MRVSPSHGTTRRLPSTRTCPLALRLILRRSCPQLRARYRKWSLWTAFTGAGSPLAPRRLTQHFKGTGGIICCDFGWQHCSLAFGSYERYPLAMYVLGYSTGMVWAEAREVIKS